MKSEKQTKLNSLTDFQLIEELQMSNPNAFTALYERYKYALSNFAYYKLRDRELARDLVQNVFTSLWDNRINICLRGSFESYIYTIVRNKLTDHWRRSCASGRYLDTIKNYVSETINDTDHLLRHNELSRAITKALAELPEKLRTVIELRTNASMPRKEIAEKLGISEEGVKTRIRRALKILKSKIQTNF